MSSKLCIECRTAEVSGRRTRCPECRRLRRNRLERTRYEDHADEISERRLLRRHGPAAFEAAEYGDEPKVVDYSRGGMPQPGMIPVPASTRQHWTHDQATRIQALAARAAQESGEDELADMRSWDEVVNQPPDHKVTFPAPDMGHSDPFGRRSSRYQGQPITNPAADGQAFTGSTASGERELYRHTGGPR